jgi:CRP-like cAMP-binding protein
MPATPSTAAPLTADDHALISRSPLLGSLDDGARAAVLGRCGLRRLARGGGLFLQNDPATELFLVLDGWVKVFRLTAEGGEAVIHVFRAGESFAEPAVFGLGRYPASAEAATEARVLAIPGAALVDTLRAEPGLALRIIGVFSQRLHHLVEETERRQVLATPARLAAFLLGLIEARPLPTAPVALRLPYDKALVAARLGMTPESFSRALGKLRAAGVDSHGPDIRLDNPRRLAEHLGLAEDS